MLFTIRVKATAPDDSAFELEVRELGEAEDCGASQARDRFVGMRRGLEA